MEKKLIETSVIENTDIQKDSTLKDIYLNKSDSQPLKFKK